MTEITEEIEDLVFDKKERDIRINLLAHRFLGAQDDDWRIVKSRLIELYKIYFKTRAVRLCAECLTIYSSNRKMIHSKISVASIFDHINPNKQSKDEIAEFFAKNGRTKKDDEGNILIGVPTFDHPCLSIYRFLDGSSLPERFKEKEVETEMPSYKAQKPMIVFSTLEQMMMIQKDKAEPLLKKHLEKTEIKKGEDMFGQGQNGNQEKISEIMKTPEHLSKRRPERRTYNKNILEKKVERSNLKTPLKSPIKPFIIHTGGTHNSLLKYKKSLSQGILK